MSDTTRLGRLARRSSVALGATISILSTFLVVPALIAPAQAAQAPAATYQLTVAARYCPTYESIWPNRAQNNLQETFRLLGPKNPDGTPAVTANPPYTDQMANNPVNPANETFGGHNGACTPIPDWTFTLGSGLAGGSPSNLSVVTGKNGTVTTTGSVPELDSAGKPVSPARTVAGAQTITLSQTQADLALQGSALWIQGGVQSPRAGNEGQLNGQQGKYAFGALRCAVDNLNGDNVEYIQYTGGATHVFCYAYYTDKEPYGTITIKKKTADGSSSDAFWFASNVSYGAPARRDFGDFTLKGGGGATFERAATGSKDDPYFVTEKDLPTGWSLTDITCTADGSTISDKIGPDGSLIGKSIMLKGGSNVVCTFTNSKAPTITITKTVTGDTTDPTRTFDFTVSNDKGPIATVSNVPGNGQSTVVTLPTKAQTITVTENSLAAGWTQTSLTCKVNGTAAGTTFPIKAGDVVACAAANSFSESALPTATVTVTKVVDSPQLATPTYPEGGFPFTATKQNLTTDAEAFTLGSTVGESKSTTRTYKILDGSRAVKITEGASDGWSLVSGTCTLAGSTTTVTVDGTGLAALTLKAGQAWTCVYTNKPATAKLTIVKNAGGDKTTMFPFTHSSNFAGLPGAAVAATVSEGSPLVLPYQVAKKGSDVTFGENLPADSLWSLTGVVCKADGGTGKTVSYANGGSITLAKGDDVVCTFTNTKNTAKVIIKKDARPATTATFGFGVGADGSAVGGTVAVIGNNSDSATVTLPNIKANGTTVTVAETSTPDGSWKYDSVTCVSGTTSVSTLSFTALPGETWTCTVVNTQDATVTVKKTTVGNNGILTGPQSFGFTVDASALTATNTGNETTTAGTVAYSKLAKAGTSVTITETSKGADWTLTARTCSVDGEKLAGTNAVTLTLKPGDKVVCEFTNTLTPTTATVQVVKRVSSPITDPVYPAAGFGFTATGTSLPTGADTTFALPKDGDNTLTYQLVGGQRVINVTEGASPGWSLQGALCRLGAGAGSAYVNGSSLTIKTGEKWVCEFTNTPKLATLVVAKSIGDLSAPGVTFPFTFTPADASKVLTGGPAVNPVAVTPGTPVTYVYQVTTDTSVTVTESGTPGWELASTPTCDDAQGLGARTTFNPTVSAALTVGATTTCSFANRTTTFTPPVVDKVADPVTGTTVQPGSTISYTVTVPNTGDRDATVVLTDAVTGDASIVAGTVVVMNGATAVAAGDITVGAKTIAVVGQTLAAGKALTLTYSVTVGSVQGGTVDNTATAVATDPISGITYGPSEGTTTHPVAKGDLAITKTVDKTGPVAYGTELTYTVTVVASGDLVQTNVKAGDTIPAGTTYVTGSAAVDFGTVNDADPLAWNVGTLRASDGVKTLTFKVTVDNPPAGAIDGAYTVKNTATVASDQSGPKDATASTTTGSPFVPPVVEKVADPADGTMVQPGSVIKYTVTVPNKGDRAATVTLSDTMTGDATITGVPVVTNGGFAGLPGDVTVVGKTITVAPQLVATGTALVLVYSVTVGPTPGATLVNTATSVASDPVFGTTYEPTTGTTTHTTPVPEPIVGVLTVTAEPLCTPEGRSYLTYTVTGAPEGAVLDYTWTDAAGAVVGRGTLADATGQLDWPGTAGQVLTLGVKASVEATVVAAGEVKVTGPTCTAPVPTPTPTPPAPGPTPPGPNPGPLPHTGGEVGTLLGLGGAGLLIGLVLMALGGYRPRRWRAQDGH